MKSFFDELEAQLEVAATEQIATLDTLSQGHGNDRAPGTRGPGWLGTVARAIPVGVALLAALAIPVVAVTLLHHSQGPNSLHGPASPPPSSQGPVQLLPAHLTRTP